VVARFPSGKKLTKEKNLVAARSSSRRKKERKKKKPCGCQVSNRGKKKLGGC